MAGETTYFVAPGLAAFAQTILEGTAATTAELNFPAVQAQREDVWRKWRQQYEVGLMQLTQDYYYTMEDWMKPVSLRQQPTVQATEEVSIVTGEVRAQNEERAHRELIKREAR